MFFEFLECLSVKPSMRSNTFSSLACRASLVVHMSQVSQYLASLDPTSHMNTISN
jgi:hypothetical protein